MIDLCKEVIEKNFMLGVASSRKWRLSVMTGSMREKIYLELNTQSINPPMADPPKTYFSDSFTLPPIS